MNSQNVLFDYPDPKDFVLLIRDGNRRALGAARPRRYRGGGFGGDLACRNGRTGRRN